MSSIDSKNLKVWIDKESAGGIGGFSWGMDFNWIDIKWYEGDHPTGKWEPKRTPTIIGALNAISKDFFMRLGMFDPDFDIWGGEDVELSFKVWLCGGKVEYIPCSFAAHMYKDHKYTVSYFHFEHNTESKFSPNSIFSGPSLRKADIVGTRIALLKFGLTTITKNIIIVQSETRKIENMETSVNDWRFVIG